jgi:hypothetical protein
MTAFSMMIETGNPTSELCSPIGGFLAFRLIVLWNKESARNARV